MRFGLGDCLAYNEDGSCEFDDGSGTSGTIGVTGTPVDITNSNLCSGMTAAQCAALLAGSPSADNSTVNVSTTGSGGTATTATSSNPITALLASLNSAASGAVKAAVTPAPYYITNPATGQSALYNPATGTFVGSTGTSILGTTGSSGLLLLALAAFAVFALEGKH